jgi:AhpD family alkylhydroperoxidase
LKACQELRIVEHVAQQDFERHRPVADGKLLGEEDRPHAAFAQPADQPVAAGKTCREIRVARLHHAHEARTITRAEVRIVIVGSLALRADTHVCSHLCAVSREHTTSGRWLEADDSPQRRNGPVTSPREDLGEVNSSLREFHQKEDASMPTCGMIEYDQTGAEVRVVYDDIMATRKTDRVNNFWKALAHDPALLRRTWESVKQTMAPGALDPLMKEMIYVAVSVTNQCGYCIASHTAAARKAGMTDAMFAELMGVIGMANETNRLASGYQVEIDEQFKTG